MSDHNRGWFSVSLVQNAVEHADADPHSFAMWQRGKALSLGIVGIDDMVAAFTAVGYALTPVRKAVSDGIPAEVRERAMSGAVDVYRLLSGHCDDEAMVLAVQVYTDVIAKAGCLRTPGTVLMDRGRAERLIELNAAQQELRQAEENLLNTPIRQAPSAIHVVTAKRKIRAASAAIQPGDLDPLPEAQP